VNSAAIDLERSTEPTWDIDIFDRTHATNLRGLFLSMRAEIPLMREGGAIVNIGSIGGLRGVSSRLAYATAKHGLIGLTRSAALHYISRGIRVNAVCPGPVDTPMLQASIGPNGEEPMKSRVPAHRIARADEIADAIMWLCSTRSAYVVGQGLAVDGGMSA
jgi:NAD(P)-dependent dehydrogenase (short-subunit alcohol dehydrogenase family)